MRYTLRKLGTLLYLQSPRERSTASIQAKKMTDFHSTLELVEHDGCSTLELFRHDETARAPERDTDATAFELDGSCLAPEVIRRSDSRYRF